MLAQMLPASPQQSAAFDEGYTITYGYAYLRAGDARVSRGQNPPLTNLLIALPLLLRDDVAFPSDHPTWAKADIYGFSDEFLWKANVDRAAQLVLWARLPEMGLALLLACVVYAFTRSLFGGAAALFALFLCVFDPNILAHGHTVGTDLGVTLFLFSAVWMWTQALKRSELRYALLAGLLTGAALATKYSAVWLAPILLVLGLAYPGLHDHWRPRAKMVTALGLAALAVIWGTFAFSLGPIAPGGLAVPAPQYWESLGTVFNRVESSTPAFMLGHISSTGSPLYYPFVFLVKTPLPTLVLLVAGAVNLIARHRREDIAAWFPPLLFMLAAMISGLNLGYRLILPMLPFMLMIAGQGTAAILTGIIRPRRRGAGQPAAMRTRADTETDAKNAPWLRGSVVGLLLLWLVVDVLSIAPSHIAYFNQLVSRNTDYEALVDSNLDWGQDLVALREWQQRNAVNDLKLAYYGTARPEAYGVRASLLPSFTLNEFGPEVDGFNAYALRPGRYAISATSLQLGTLYSRWRLYEAFKTREPEERAGRSFLIYNVAYPAAEVDRAVVLGPVASDLDRDTLGGSPDRELIVKWAGQDAAVVDMQGPARYVARGGEPLIGFAPEVHAALVAQGAKLGADASGDLRRWEIDARSALSGTLDQPRGLAQPIGFEGGLTLLGYDLRARPGQPIDLVTYWRVEQTPAQSLSIFAHVVDAAGNILAQRDGLNVRLSSLEPGDVVLQHFVIDHPTAARELRLGLYDPRTRQRFTATLPAGEAVEAVQVPLQ
jgi:hypothetical protein